MILCYSGGLDSMIAWHFLRKPKSIYFNCSEYSAKEINSIKFTNPDCKISNALDFRSFEKGPNAYIPHRNLMFAAVASNYSNKVVIAGVKDDVVPDKNPYAFYSMSGTLSDTSKNKVEVTSPFWDMTKSQVVKWFLDNVPNAMNLVSQSVSCYNFGSTSPCTQCPSCFRKANALWDNGIYTRFNNNKMFHEYYKKACDGRYDPARNKSIIKFYEEYKVWQKF